MSPELKIVLREIWTEIGSYPTGQEFLDHTNNNMSLYSEYIEFWDNVVMPEVVANIKTNGTVEEARTLDAHSKRT